MTVHCDCFDCLLRFSRLSTVIFLTVPCSFLDCPPRFSGLSALGFPAVVLNLGALVLNLGAVVWNLWRCCFRMSPLLFLVAASVVLSLHKCFLKRERKKQNSQDQNDQMTYVHVSLTNLKIINVPVIIFLAFERAEACTTGEQVFISLLSSVFDTKLKKQKKTL